MDVMKRCQVEDDVIERLNKRIADVGKGLKNAKPLTTV